MRSKLFPTRSIKGKLATLTVSSVGLALLVCCLAFAIHDGLMFRRSMVQQLSALSQVLASNSTAAMSFGESAVAGELLQSLRNRPEIESACLLDRNGQLFAFYSRSGSVEAPPLSPPLPDGVVFTDDGFLDINSAVIEDGERLGTIRLRATMDGVRRQILGNIGITVGVLAVSLAVGFLSTVPMQRSISQPILQLATTAGKISRDGDYTHRVETTTTDEIGVLYEQFNEMLDRIQAADDELHKAHDELEQRVAQRTELLWQANEQLKSEMAARERTVYKLKQTQGELMEASRKAGMADIADGVLHNIGNVLNSVNVSTSLAAEKVERLRLSGLTATVELLGQHESDLASFFQFDEKGKRLPEYLARLADNLMDEQRAIVQELRRLIKNVNHIKEIVRSQQSYASMGGVIVECSPAELMEDALQFVEGSLNRHQIEVRREFDEITGFQVDKSKLLQVLVNLIKNAKEALTAGDSDDRTITLRALQRNERIIFEVADNGMGIAPDKLTKIFSHGFTTKQGGHGFGLHASANTAAEMGGSMSVRSDGLGAGATFTIDLPLALVRNRNPVTTVVTSGLDVPTGGFSLMVAAPVADDVR